MTHEDKVQKARDAIAAVFADCTVHTNVTVSDLEELKEDIEMKLEALEADTKRG